VGEHAEKPGTDLPANFAGTSPSIQHGEVATWNVNDYTPADPCDPGALGGLGTNGITVEMAPCTIPRTTARRTPAEQRQLFKLTLSEEANLTVTLNEIRGGVVLTNPDVAATVDLSQATGVAVESGEDLLPPVIRLCEWWPSASRIWPIRDKPRRRRCLASPARRHVLRGTSDLNVLTDAWQVKELPSGPASPRSRTDLRRLRARPGGSSKQVTIGSARTT